MGDVFSAGCEHIIRVRFHHCAYIDDDAILYLVNRLQESLQTLELSSCDVSDAGLGHLTRLQSVYCLFTKKNFFPLPFSELVFMRLLLYIATDHFFLQ